ncbi:MAG: DUF1641 domain-containing protein, partial [Thermoproteus sp.]|nr:DUF1641 domain-containing protein [Thermoproteus sp.]
GVLNSDMALYTYVLITISSAAASADVSKPVDIYGLLKSLADPDVQRGLGYFVSLAKNLGACMSK